MKILIVDDQKRARQSMRALLDTWQSVEEIREAGSGSEAIQQVEQFQPELVITDVRMLSTDGVKATRQIKRRWPDVKVVVLSMYPDYEPQAMAAGADAFVCKGESPEKLLLIIDAIASSIDKKGSSPSKGKVS